MFHAGLFTPPPSSPRDCGAWPRGAGTHRASEREQPAAAHVPAYHLRGVRDISPLNHGVRDSAAAADRSPRLYIPTGHRRARSLLRLTRVLRAGDHPETRARSSVVTGGNMRVPRRITYILIAVPAPAAEIRARTRGPDLDPSSFRSRLLRDRDPGHRHGAVCGGTDRGEVLAVTPH